MVQSSLVQLCLMERLTNKVRRCFEIVEFGKDRSHPPSRNLVSFHKAHSPTFIAEIIACWLTAL